MTKARGFSPLERRLLLALVSHMRDRVRDPWSPHETDELHCMPDVDVPLKALYESCYVIKPDRSWELQRRNQRQAMRRALGRLHPDYVTAYALAWVNVETWDHYEWQGGGKLKLQGDSRYPQRTPNWKRVRLTDVGVQVAVLLERESE